MPSNRPILESVRAPLCKRAGLPVPADYFGQATAVAGAATLNTRVGLITSEALVTAAAGVYTLTLTDSQMHALAVMGASVNNGTNTTGTPAIGLVIPAAGSAVIHVRNIHASAAFNGTVVVSFNIENPA